MKHSIMNWSNTKTVNMIIDNNVHCVALSNSDYTGKPFSQNERTL